MHLRFLLSYLIPGIVFISCNSQKELIKEGQQPQLISNEFEFTEGPASDAEGNVYFTDQPNNKIHKWYVKDGSVSVFMEDAGRANELYFDSEGKLLVAADENSEIWKLANLSFIKQLMSRGNNW